MAATFLELHLRMHHCWAVMGIMVVTTSHSLAIMSVTAMMSFVRMSLVFIFIRRSLNGQSVMDVVATMAVVGRNIRDHGQAVILVMTMMGCYRLAMMGITVVILHVGLC